MAKEKKEVMGKKRLEYLDIVKAIAMISVVFFHASSNQNNIYTTQNAFWIRFTSAYAIPVFFFVNGYLYKNNNVHKPHVLIWKKIKSYYVPFLCYNVAYVIFHNLFVAAHMVDEQYGNGYYDTKAFIKHLITAVTGHRELFAGALWFLGSILIVSVIVIMTEFVIEKCYPQGNKYIVLGILVALCAIFGYSEYAPERMKIDTSLQSLVYFYFGMIYKKYNLNERFLRRKGLYVCLGIVLNFIYSYNYQYNPFGMTSRSVYILLSYVNAIICIIAIMMISQVPFIMKSKLMAIIGSNTLDIMALHFMVFKLASFIIIFVKGFSILRLPEYPVLTGVNGGWWILYWVLGLAIPTIFSIMRHKLADMIKKCVVSENKGDV